MPENSDSNLRPEFNEPDPRDPSQVTPAEPGDWVTKEEIEALTEERDVMGYDEVQQAENILRENLPAVTHAVVKLARSAQSETVRLSAAKYVVDRNLGKITEPESADAQDALREFLNDVVVSK